MPPDVGLSLRSEEWHGIGDGHGHLHARQVVVEAGGRRAAARTRTVSAVVAGGGWWCRCRRPAGGSTARSARSETGDDAVTTQVRNGPRMVVRCPDWPVVAAGCALDEPGGGLLRQPCRRLVARGS